jgi:hypothetical protein
VCVSVGVMCDVLYLTGLKTHGPELLQTLHIASIESFSYNLVNLLGNKSGSTSLHKG